MLDYERSMIESRRQPVIKREAVCLSIPAERETPQTGTTDKLGLGYLPPSYVVQEGELSVHQAGQEGDLSTSVGRV